ncbi:MAG: DNA polymerase I [Defluviitaleaceae bacterium]|nr:DNA polymerase I [Defluviitaleaceae bacterium]
MKILLFDGFSILNRAYYALPLLTTSEGEYTNAVYGFMSIFFRFCDEENPDYITVAFDLPQPTFRHERYGAYKGTRRSMPDELRAQVPTLKTLLGKMGIHIASVPGYEADDVLGTLAQQAVSRGIKPVIVSGDRDLLQLATDEVKIRLPKTKAGKTEVEDYHAADVLEKYGVTPTAYIDVKALMGDSSDNIPGVPGIGEVTATKIIAAYGSLENALAHAEEIKPKKAAQNLSEYRDQAILSRELAAIVTNAPVELELSGLEQMRNEAAFAEIKRLELKTLYKRFLPADEASASSSKPETEYEIIKNAAKVAEFFADLNACEKGMAFCPLWEAADNNAQYLIGIAISRPDSPAVYIPAYSEIGKGDGLTEAELLKAAAPWLESGAPKYVYDVKSEIGRLRSFGIQLNGVDFDAMLAAYVLDALQSNSHPADIASAYLQETIPTLEEILDNKGKRGKDRRTVADLPIETAAGYAVRVADCILRARPILEERLAATGQTGLFRNMELPLAFVLAEMEGLGIKVNKSMLIAFDKIMNERLAGLTAAIYELAGEEFNINSPAQLGMILFEKLGLRGGKKTTKGYSTAADVLEKLANKHPLVPLVLEYRTHAKLKSTYVDGLMPLIKENSRVYSTFHQALTATGRLSSAEPNLQNIPVRTSLGRELRKAFVPGEGRVFVDADYSQIELRLLAHMSGDEILIKAFNENQDIHRLTASQVLGIAPEDVTPEQRGNAKAVNFGIIYGISAFGLSDDLGIPVKEAERYIRGYFEKYPGIKAYLDETISRAKKDGFVATLFNRRRALPELKSSNFNQRSFGERVAMNMPIQGSAADIIKIAMLNVTARLKRENLATRIILQVHDELLLEAPVEEAELVQHILKEEMENAAELAVELAADVNVGDSWYDTK